KITVTEAASMGHSFRVNLVSCSCDFRNFVDGQEATNDGITLTPILRKNSLSFAAIIDAQRSRRTHRLPPRHFAGYSNYLKLPSFVTSAPLAYSTVTLFARLRGWSTSVPFRTAT